MAVILRYLTEFDSFAGRLRHIGWRKTCPQNVVSHLHLAKTAPRSSRTVSLRQLSVLLPTHCIHFIQLHERPQEAIHRQFRIFLLLSILLLLGVYNNVIDIVRIRNWTALLCAKNETSSHGGKHRRSQGCSGWTKNFRRNLQVKFVSAPQHTKCTPGGIRVNFKDFFWCVRTIWSLD